MTKEQFAVQIERLKSCYGERNYGGERIKILFEALKGYQGGWFEGVVTRFICESRQSPLPKEFFEAARKYDDEAQEREIANEVRGDTNFKEVLGKLSTKCENQTFSKACMQVVNQAGEIPLEEYYAHCDLLDEAARKLAPGQCSQCNGAGYTWEKGLHRCWCPLGGQRPKIAYGPKNQEGKREEFFIPQARRE